MNIRFLSLIMILFHPAFVVAQNLDSLERILPGLRNRERVDVLNRIAIAKQTEGGEEEVNEALLLARKIGYRQGEAKSLVVSGFVFFHQEQDELAIDYFKQALELSDEDMYEITVYANAGLGEIAIIEGDFTVALEKGLLALSIAKKHNFVMGIIEARHLLTLVYDSFFNWKESEKQLDSLLAMSSSFSTNDLALLYLDLGENLNNQEDSKRALDYLRKGKAMLNDLENEYEKRYLASYCNANLAVAYVATNSPDSALIAVKKAIAIDSNSLDTINLAMDYLIMSDAYLTKKKYEAARKYAKMALFYGEGRIGVGYLMDIYNIFEKLSMANGDFEKAVQYKDTVIFYVDSVNSIVNDMAIKGQKAQFDLEEKKARIKYLNEENQANRRLIGMGALLVFTLMLAFVLLLNRLKVGKRAHAMKMKLLEMKQEQKQQEMKALFEKKNLEEKFLQEKIEIQNRSLASNAIFIANKNQLVADIREALEKIVRKSKGEIGRALNTILRDVERRGDIENDWQYFNEHFRKVHPSFYRKIRQDFPDLSEADYRFCSYIHLKLSNKEIAQLQNISPDSVIKARYRLKKKMNIEGSLTEIIVNM